MIRFLNLKNQIDEGSTDFAFYDTISNTILGFGEQGTEVFDSIDSFKYEFGIEVKGTTRPLSRFLSLIPDDFFLENNNKNNMTEEFPALEVTYLLTFTDAAFRDVMRDEDGFWRDNFIFTGFTDELEKTLDERCKTLKIKRRI